MIFYCPANGILCLSRQGRALASCDLSCERKSDPSLALDNYYFPDVNNVKIVIENATIYSRSVQIPACNDIS